MGNTDRPRDVEPLLHPPSLLLCPLCKGISEPLLDSVILLFLFIALFLCLFIKAKRSRMPFDVKTKFLKVVPFS